MATTTETHEVKVTPTPEEAAALHDAIVIMDDIDAAGDLGKHLRRALLGLYKAVNKGERFYLTITITVEK